MLLPRLQGSRTRLSSLSSHIFATDHFPLGTCQNDLRKEGQLKDSTEPVPKGLLNFRPVQISFERCLGSATALSLQRPSPFCHPERTRISCFTTLTGDHGCGSLQREPHAADRSRNSRQEIRGRRGICGAPFVCPAPTGPQPPPIITDPYGNTNLSFLIPGFQEWSAEPQIPRLRSPGFPVELDGVDEPHPPFHQRKAHTRPCPEDVAGNPGRDDKERAALHKEWLLNRGIFQIEFGQPWVRVHH
jgi:hypothetical protein